MSARKTGMALSVNQPWAWLTVNGYKDVENRAWGTTLRGVVGIHASMKFDTDGYLWIAKEFPHILMPEPHSFDRGGIVGRATLVDCVESYDSPWFYGPHGFVWRQAEPLPFQRCRGRLGFFRPEFRTLLPPPPGL